MISKRNKTPFAYQRIKNANAIARGILGSILLILIVLHSANLNAQTDYQLHFIDSHTKASIKTATIPSFDSLLVRQLTERTILSLWTKGYAEAGIDSTINDSTQTTFFLHRGVALKNAQFKLIPLQPTSVELPKYIRVRKFGLPSLTSSTDQLLSSCENQGYPFASFKLDSVSISNHSISGVLRFDSGTLVTFDTLIIKGKFRVNKPYLIYLLGVQKGTIYRERTIKQISSTINKLEYLAELRPAEAEFIPRKARVYVYLRQRKANQISALIGVTGKESGGLTVKGDINLRLLNTLNVGEKLEIRWKKLEANEQKFEATATFPWLGLGGLGFWSGINIYRRDTSVLLVNPKVALTWSAPGGHRLYALLDIRKVATSGKVTLPGYGTTSAMLYGLGYNFERIKATLFPTSEVKVNAGASIGSRYADYLTPDQKMVSRKSTSFGLNGKVSYYQSIVRRFGLFAGYSGGATGAFGGEGYNKLYYNELLQIGGYNSLRGFDEEFFWVSSFHVGTAELRYYFESESFVSVFLDKGYLERSYIVGFQTFTPIGIGIATQLTISNGLFQLAYALGGNNGASPKIKEAKVHFGYTARF